MLILLENSQLQNTLSRERKLTTTFNLKFPIIISHFFGSGFSKNDDNLFRSDFCRNNNNNATTKPQPTTTQEKSNLKVFLRRKNIKRNSFNCTS